MTSTWEGITRMSTFWIVGIILNVTLTGLILYWLFKQARPKSPDAEAARPASPESDPRKPADETHPE